MLRIFLFFFALSFRLSPLRRGNRRSAGSGKLKSGGGNAAAVHEALGRNQPLFGGDCGPDGVCAWWSPHQLVRAAKLTVLRTRRSSGLPARTALPRHTCAYTHAAQCARPLRNKRSQLLIDACAQLANPQVARRDPARTCGRQSVGRNGPVRGLLRPRRYTDAPHMRPFLQR